MQQQTRLHQNYLSRYLISRQIWLGKKKRAAQQSRRQRDLQPEMQAQQFSKMALRAELVSPKKNLQAMQITNLHQGKMQMWPRMGSQTKKQLQEHRQQTLHLSQKMLSRLRMHRQQKVATLDSPRNSEQR